MEQTKLAITAWIEREIMAEQTSNYTVEEQLRGLIEQLDAYIEQYHGGSVELVSFDGRIVRVHLGGACEDCDLSPSTLKGWVEGTVKQFFPEVERVDPA
jgi:Fe-S cluster biogenesis protein NfuA